MADKTMKTLTIGTNIYEIVDEYARSQVESVESTANEATQIADNAIELANQAIGMINELPEPPVKSVNNMTGDVVIEIPDVPVTSVNGQTGDVVIEIPDVPVKSVNGKTGNVIIDVPVTSVNGQTGDVIIPVVRTVTTTLNVPINEWMLDETYDVYSRTFEVSDATTDATLYIDCLTGMNFPIVGARCNTDGEIIIYMADIPTVAQEITITFKKEV